MLDFINLDDRPEFSQKTNKKALDKVEIETPVLLA